MAELYTPQDNPKIYTGNSVYERAKKFLADTSRWGTDTSGLTPALDEKIAEEKTKSNTAQKNLKQEIVKKSHKEVMPAPKVEVKPEAKPAPKVEVKPEAKPAPKVEVKPEAKPAPKVEVKPEAKPAPVYSPAKDSQKAYEALGTITLSQEIYKSLEQTKQQYATFLTKSYKNKDKQISSILNESYASPGLEISDTLVFNNTPLQKNWQLTYIAKSLENIDFQDTIQWWENKIIVSRKMVSNTKIPIMRVYIDGKLFMATIAWVGPTDAKTIQWTFNISNTKIDPEYVSKSYDYIVTVDGKKTNYWSMLMPDAIQIKEWYFIHQWDIESESAGCIQIEWYYAHALRKQMEIIRQNNKNITQLNTDLYS
jgi:hypothetical protein